MIYCLNSPGSTSDRAGSCNSASVFFSKNGLKSNTPYARGNVSLNFCSQGKRMKDVFDEQESVKITSKINKSLNTGPSGPWGRRLAPVSFSMKRLGVLLLPPGWDASPSQGCPQHICWYPFVHLGEEKHC